MVLLNELEIKVGALLLCSTLKQLKNTNNGQMLIMLILKYIPTNELGNP